MIVGLLMFDVGMIMLNGELLFDVVCCIDVLICECWVVYLF